MQTNNWWVRLLRMGSYLAVLLGGLFALDRFGHIFVPGHSLVYWIGVVFTFVLLAFWPDLVMTTLGRRTLFAMFGGSTFEPVESCKTKGLRWWGQVGLVFLMLVILDRITDGIFSIWHPVSYWPVFLGIVIVVAAWPEIALSPGGQRALSSNLAERTVLVITSLLMTLAAVELFMHTNFSKYHVFGIWPTYAYEPELVFKKNSLGFRDVEHQIEPEPDVTRVVIIGDSVTAGVGVRESDVYINQLREKAGDSVEFILTALPGSNTYAQMELFINYGCQYQPDIVIVGVYINDIEREGMPTPYSWTPEPILTRLKSPHSYTPVFFYQFDYYITQVRDAMSESRQKPDPYDQSMPWVDLWQADIEMFAQEITACDVDQMYAITLPIFHSDGDEERYELIEQLFDNAGFEAFNLYPEFVEDFGDRPPKSLWALPNDGHPSAELHSWYADHIWAIIEPELTAEN